MNKLLYRRQFVLSNKTIPGLDTWKNAVIASHRMKLNLYCHPDLKYYRAKNNDFELVILGYILDPEHPLYTDNDVINDLLKNGSSDELFKSIEKYNGRFVLIYFTKQELKLINDATGFREIYYSIDGETISIGSTPNILSEFTKLPKTQDRDILAFYNSKEFIDSQSLWIGPRTLYQNILHLLPNHYLDVIANEVKRFWPNERLENIGLYECAIECASILKGTMESAVNRYNIHLGITAGWDTRLLLSSTKEFVDRIFYYVNKPESYPPSHIDLVIPDLLAKNLNFKLNIVDISNDYDQDFAKIFFKNNVLARKLFLPTFYDVYKRDWQNSFTVSGTMGNGLARIYMRIPKGLEINGKNVARLSNFHRQEYAVSALDKWVDGIKNSLNDWNVDVMDLYQVEQDNAHWASLSSSEQDIVRDEIRPFNNRRLIRLFWSLDDKHRYQYYPHIYIKIIQLLWKEVLKYPINPTRRSQIYRLLRLIGIEQSVYHYYKRRKFFMSGN